MLTVGQRVTVRPEISDELRNNPNRVRFVEGMNKTLGESGTIFRTMMHGGDACYYVEFDNDDYNDSPVGKYWVYREDWLITSKANDVTIEEDE